MSGKALAITAYQRVVDDISALCNAARRTLVELHWRIGKRVVEAEQHGQLRAAYGSALLKHLSADLTKKFGKGCSVESLQNMRRFYVTHKNYPTSDKLAWSHYVELLPVDDGVTRLQLERRAIREHLPIRAIRALVKKATGKTTAQRTGGTLARLTDLRLDTYAPADNVPLKAPAGQRAIDCGFAIYRCVPTTNAGIVITTKPSYTYRAEVERVIDGDTLWVFINVGFGSIIREKIRLRGIDAPELPTPAGKRAKAFVQKRLPVGSQIIIRTSTSDKYDRYLADVLYGEKNVRRQTCDVRRKEEPHSRLTSSHPTSYDVQNAETTTHDAYLNQELLDHGLATAWK